MTWTALLALSVIPLVGPLDAQVREDAEPLPTDSTELHKAARELQAQFEAYRQSNLPSPVGWGPGFACDLMIGRICKRFGRDRPFEMGNEPVEISLARMEMMKELGAIQRRIPGDDWVLGQTILYLGEEGRWDLAESLVRDCRSNTEWWCAALHGMALHNLQRFEEAEERFRTALESMPQKQAADWTDPRVVLDGSGDGKAGDWKGTAADTMAAWVWHLSDPLYMVPGNDRWTEQMARWTEVHIREDAEHPFGIPWGFDLKELTLRFGASIAWERRRTPQTQMNLNPAPDMIGRSKPHARQFVPPGDLVSDPTGIPWSSWHLEVNSPHTTYAPDYSPIFRPLDSQIARFRRGDSLRVVAAYTPGPGTAPAVALDDWGQPQVQDSDPWGSVRDEANRPAEPRREDPWGRSSMGYSVEPPLQDEPPPGPMAEGALFLSPGPGRGPFRFDGPAGGSGVYDVQVPDGAYIASLEVTDVMERRSWRARQGVRQAPMTLGVPAISDVLLVRDVGDLPETLEASIPNALPGHAIPEGGSIVAAWEVYGLLPSESMAVNVVVSEPGGDFFQRIGELLRLTEPEEPVALTWEEGGPEGMQAFFRSVRLSLPNLPAGEYILNIEVVVQGRSPLVAATPLLITP